MTILLSDDKLKGFSGWHDCIATKNRNTLDLCYACADHDLSIAKAQLKADYEYLMQPCTEHPIPDKIAEDLTVREMRYEPELMAHYYRHRKDCPACMSNFEKEAKG